jgi:hypothetical protein
VKDWLSDLRAEEWFIAASLQINVATRSKNKEERGNVILSAAASPIQTRTSAGRRPKDLESALGPEQERAP